MKADVAELADALDSKSGGRKAVWVRPPPSAPLNQNIRGSALNKLLKKTEIEPIIILRLNKMNIRKKSSVK